jgi:FG-GAP repeat protein
MRPLPLARVISWSSPLLVPLLAAISPAQETLWERDGISDTYVLGVNVTRGGDLDGDGLTDLLVGVDYGGLSYPGLVRALRGYDGSDLFVIHGAPNEILGWSIAGLDDVDGDHVPDFAASSAAAGGQVVVYSGATQAQIYAVPGAQYETKLLALGDVDGDLVTDFAAARRGSVTSEIDVRSGATGALLYTLSRNSNTFGIALARVDDVDLDGIPDLLVGDTVDPTSPLYGGAAHLFSGRDGTWLLSVFGDGGFDQDFGYSVAGIGDVDGDGIHDLAIGGPEFRYLDPNTDGEVFVYSGATGAFLHEWSGLGSNTFFGEALVETGDVTGDGISDLLVGAPGASQLFDDVNGAIYLYSGATLQPIVYRLGDELFSKFGSSIASVGDVDGDGAADFAVATPYGGGQYGAVHLIHGSDLFFNSNMKFPVAGADLVLTTSAGDPDQPALLVVEEVDGGPLFLPVVSSLLNANGEWHLPATVPSGLAGHSVALRSWSLDLNGKIVTSSLERLCFR